MFLYLSVGLCLCSTLALSRPWQRCPLAVTRTRHCWRCRWRLAEDWPKIGQIWAIWSSLATLGAEEHWRPLKNWKELDSQIFLELKLKCPVVPDGASFRLVFYAAPSPGIWATTWRWRGWWFLLGRPLRLEPLALEHQLWNDQHWRSSKLKIQRISVRCEHQRGVHSFKFEIYFWLHPKAFQV